MVLVQTYIFDQGKFIIMLGRFSILLFLRIRIIHWIVGWDANDVIIKTSLKFTQYSIVISAICDYMLIDKGGIYHGKFRQ